jgi:hypothetical protein
MLRQSHSLIGQADNRLTFTGAAERVRRLATARLETPWQDRKTLLGPRKRAAASRRLAHGFRPAPKHMMKDEDNVRQA